MRVSHQVPVVTQDFRSESCHFGHTPVQDGANDTKGEPQNGFCVAPEVQQYTGITISEIRPVFGQLKHAFIYDLGEKITALGIHQLKADPTVQEMSPRKSQKQTKPL